jgi:hypothetical protein
MHVHDHTAYIIITSIASLHCVALLILHIILVLCLHLYWGFSMEGVGKFNS